MPAGRVAIIALPSRPANRRRSEISPTVLSLLSTQVTSSPESQKRQFLEKKGLTAEEIEEAFKRAPQPTTAAATTPATTAPTTTTPAAQPVAASPANSGGLRWTQVVSRTAMAIGALGMLIGRFKRGGASGSAGASPDEASASRDAAATSASASETDRKLEAARIAAERSARDAADARAQSAELARSLDDVKATMERARADASVAAGSTPAAVTSALDGIKRELRDELRGAVAAAVADATANIAHTPTSVGSKGDPGAMPESVKEELAQIRAMLLASPLRGTHTPGAGAVDDDVELVVEDTTDTIVPPSKTTPRAALGSSIDAGFNQRPPQHKTPEPPAGDAPPHPPSYMQVLDMLEKGQTPPGIRDIDDKPPDPDARIPAPKMNRRSKPWEIVRAAESSAAAADVIAVGSPLSGTNGSAVKGDGDGGGGWRPPSVPSMSPDVSKVLMGRHGVGIPGTHGGGNSKERGGWLAPGSSTPEGEIQAAPPGDLTPLKPSFDR